MVQFTCNARELSSFLSKVACKTLLSYKSSKSVDNLFETCLLTASDDCLEVKAVDPEEVVVLHAVFREKTKNKDSVNKVSVAEPGSIAIKNVPSFAAAVAGAGNADVTISSGDGVKCSIVGGGRTVHAVLTNQDGMRTVLPKEKSDRLFLIGGEKPVPGKLEIVGGFKIDNSVLKRISADCENTVKQAIVTISANDAGLETIIEKPYADFSIRAKYPIEWIGSPMSIVGTYSRGFHVADYLGKVVEIWGTADDRIILRDDEIAYMIYPFVADS